MSKAVYFLKKCLLAKIKDMLYEKNYINNFICF